MRIFDWFNDHKFNLHLTIFTMVFISSIGLYFAAKANVFPIMWALLGVIALTNILALFIQ